MRTQAIASSMEALQWCGKQWERLADEEPRPLTSATLSRTSNVTALFTRLWNRTEFEALQSRPLFLRHNFDFENLRPELAGDEQSIGSGVVCDAVEDRLRIRDFRLWQQPCQIDPPHNFSVGR